MTHTIYIDILFCVNFIIDYVMLLSVKKFLSLPARRLRLLLAAFIGGIGSFVILLPPMPFFLSWLIELGEALIITAAAFMPVRLRVFIRAAVSLFLISFCLCGFMTVVLSLFSPQGLVVRNSSVYIGISPLMLIASTLVCYVIMRVMVRIMGRRIPEKINCSITVEYQGKTVKAQGIVDTGNTLHEPFSGECVIVGRAEIFRDMLDVEKYISSDNKNLLTGGIRLVPFSSVGGSGVIPAFKPSKLSLESDGKKTDVSAYIALCSEENITGGFDFLLPAELIMKGS